MNSIFYEAIQITDTYIVLYMLHYAYILHLAEQNHIRSWCAVIRLSLGCHLCKDTNNHAVSTLCINQQMLSLLVLAYLKYSVANLPKAHTQTIMDHVLSICTKSEHS